MQPRPILWIGVAVMVVIVVLGLATALPSLVGDGQGAGEGPAPSQSAGPPVRPPIPTYVVLIHGFDPSLVPAWTVWTYGTDIEANLINAGYQVVVVSYYGEFTLAFSNGKVYSDPSFYGTLNTPIESIGLELGKALKASVGSTWVNMDIIGHSMGGLVTLYMMEHVTMPNVHLQDVIFLGSPLGGAPITALSTYDNMSGYQAVEMESTSTFLSILYADVAQASSHYPNALWVVYAGDADPPWGVSYFNGPNDGLVSVASDTYLGYSHLYTFPDLHIPTLDAYDLGHVSYFEDPAVVSEMLKNLHGTY